MLTTLILAVLFLVALIYGSSAAEGYRPTHDRREELEQAMGRMSRMSIC